ncbi:hypothetical protein ACFV6B_34280 [Streptomyces microflavus]
MRLRWASTRRLLIKADLSMVQIIAEAEVSPAGATVADWLV